jgi:uncharacterized membrane protein
MQPVLTVEFFYILMGAVFASMAVSIACDRTHRKRWGSSIFWALLAVVFVFGKALPEILVGYIVLGLAALAATGQVVSSTQSGPSREQRAASAERLKNRLFWPAIVVPVTAVVAGLVFGHLPASAVWWIEMKQVTLIALGGGSLLAIALAVRTTGATALAPVAEGGRLLQAIGWALVLPQMLAALGGIFAKSGVGQVVADLVSSALPTQIPFVAVAAYCLGMALFTMCMGNAFAAFAVITGGIGVPLIVQQHHGNPAIMAGIGMLSGYCGTLLTPMAANFNIVPVMLLELKDKNAVIKAQLPVALVLLAANVLLMYFSVYRF